MIAKLKKINQIRFWTQKLNKIGIAFQCFKLLKAIDERIINVSSVD